MKINMLLVVGATLSLAACIEDPYAKDPAVNGVLVSTKYSYAIPVSKDGKAQAPPANYYRTAYDQAVMVGRGEDLTVLKDIAYEQIKLIDLDYRNVSNTLTNTVHNGHMGFEILSLGLSSAGAVFAASATKTALAASDTGVKGISTAVDIDELESTTTDAIQNQMDADRALVKQRIYESLRKAAREGSTRSYRLAQLESDLADLAIAGNIGTALKSLKAQTAQLATSNSAAAEESRTGAKINK